MKQRILIVDDERLIRWSLREALEGAGYEVVEADSVTAAMPHAQLANLDAALLDYRLPDGDGLTLMHALRATMPELPVMVITAYSSVEAAVPAIKAGANDYIAKPFEMDALLFSVRRALDESNMRRRLSADVSAKRSQYNLDAVVGESAAIQEIKNFIRRISTVSNSTVLLLGESGVGKDLLARALHFESARAAHPFVNITCTAIPESLLESELFGHEAGSFTSASTRKKGLFEMAESGTVFLDEVGDMSPALQSRLLRVLEERAFKRVGGSADIRVNVRIVAATNADLGAMVEAGTFREDLYYRLNVLPLHVPPLRERREDIPLLASHFAAGFAREFRRPPVTFTDSATKQLMAHNWPGNIRELRNVIERATLLATGTTIDLPDLQLRLANRPPKVDARTLRFPCTLADAERFLLEQALQQADNNLTRAGEILDLSRDQVRNKLRKHGLERPGS